MKRIPLAFAAVLVLSSTALAQGIPWAKSLADNQGPNHTGFSGETGGARAEWGHDRSIDFGNVYGTDEDWDFDNFKKSAGVGFRWMSPMGPIRLEYGFILDPHDSDHGMGNWEFSMASAF